MEEFLKVQMQVSLLLAGDILFLGSEKFGVKHSYYKHDFDQVSYGL